MSHARTPTTCCRYHCCKSNILPSRHHEGEVDATPASSSCWPCYCAHDRVLGLVCRPFCVSTSGIGIRVPSHDFMTLWLSFRWCLMPKAHEHCRLLPTSGPGDGFMSSAFQTKLKGNELYGRNQPEFVAYGSVVSIKSQVVGVGLLHSHADLYPEAMGQQQQITTYPYKDSNNLFRVKRQEPQGEQDLPLGEDEPLVFVRSGDRLRLEHVNTRRNLHSHPLQAPVTTRHRQVTAYGNDGIGDANDEWTIVVYDGTVGDRIRTLATTFRLIHGFAGGDCDLHTDGVPLPKWGHEQGEVTCKPFGHDPSSSFAEQTLWNVESHSNPRLPEVSTSNIAPGFFASVLELHRVMFRVNNALKPKEGEVTSQPWEWPLNVKGQKFTGWGENDLRVVLLGNAILMWGCLGVGLVFLLLLFVDAALRQRGIAETAVEVPGKAEAKSACCWLAVGWLLHYGPFFLMGRVLYFHHYMPALFLSTMLAAIVLDYLAGVLQRALALGAWARTVFVGALVVAAVGSFFLFAPLSYGMVGPLAQYQGLEWLPSWELAAPLHAQPAPSEQATVAP
eukprot:m.407471 g.407471  ORF g.407471 m.407471 type:complete len:560 (+) comp20138_c0_seq1:3375-5054(+)